MYFTCFIIKTVRAILLFKFATLSLCPGEIFIDKYTNKFGCFFFAVISNSCKRDVVDEYICLC